MSTLHKKIKLVIFDCDGTLVDTERLTNRLISEMLTERGLQISTSDCIRLFAGRTLKDIISYAESFLGPLDMSAFEKEYRAGCVPLFESELKPIDGVPELLGRMRSDYCIASNGPKEKMEISLRVSDLQKFFPASHIFSAYTIQSWKPDPALFLYAAGHFERSPDEVLVVEDSTTGVDAARRAGMNVIAYNPHNDTLLEECGAPGFQSMYDVAHYMYERELIL